MSSRSLLNLALLGVAAVLVLVIVYQPGISPEPAAQTVTTLSSDNISRIKITRTTREPLEFIRHGDKWFLSGESELPASDFQIKSLLAVLQAEAARSYPAGSLELATVGLEPPLAMSDELQWFPRGACYLDAADIVAVQRGNRLRCRFG